MSRKKARNRKATSAAAAGPVVVSAPPVGVGVETFAPLIAIAVLGFLILAVYGPFVHVPLIFDDTPAVLENDSIRSLWPLVGPARSGPLNPPAELPVSGRPVVNLTFALNYYFHSLDPAGYHVVNIAFHLVATLLLWAVVRRTLTLPYFAGRFVGVASWLALAVAMLWALHPLQTESVIYATQRTEVLMGLFYLATLYCSLRYLSEPGRPRPRGNGSSPAQDDNGANAPLATSAFHRAWLILAILASLGGMLSKEVMVSAPLIVLLFDRTFISGSLPAALRRSWPLYVGLAVTWIPLILLNLDRPHRDAAGFDFGVTGPAWWMTQSKVLFMYLRLVFWPTPLLIHYQLPYLKTFGESWMYVVPLAAIGLATLALLWKNRPLGFLGAWFFAILSPTFVIPIFTEVAAERRMYLALVIPVTICVVGVYLLLARRHAHREQPNAQPGFWSRPSAVVLIGAGVLTLLYCFMDTNRLVKYEDELSLWNSVREVYPDNLRSIEYMAWYLERSGHLDASLKQYAEVISRDNMQGDPTAIQAHYRTGIVLMKQQKFDESLWHLEIAANCLPNSTGVHSMYGYALFAADKYDAAMAEYRKALEVDPNYYPARKNLAVALLKAGRYDEAIDSFEKTLALNPNAIEIYADLAACYRRQGKEEKAAASLQHGLELARAAGSEDLVKKFTAVIEAKP